MLNKKIIKNIEYSWHKLNLLIIIKNASKFTYGERCARA